MNRIYKYELDVADTQTIDMPIQHKILSVGCQGDTLVLWVLVDPSWAETKSVTLLIYGTGEPGDAGGNDVFIGTVQMPDGLVWHVFERRA